jgi:hypothetical protein
VNVHLLLESSAHQVFIDSGHQAWLERYSFSIFSASTTDFSQLSTPVCFITSCEPRESLTTFNDAVGADIYVSISTETLAKDLDRLERWAKERNTPETQTTLVQTEITSSDGVDRIVVGLKDKLAHLETFEGFQDIVCIVSSEFLTNAFFNAPFTGKSVVGLDRKANVQLPSARFVTYSLLESEKYLTIQVIDRFGSFSRERLLATLMRCASNEMVQVRTTGFGAGIGVYMVFGWASVMTFSFTPGRETIASVKILKTKRSKLFDLERVLLVIEDKSKAQIKAA